MRRSRIACALGLLAMLAVAALAASVSPAGGGTTRAAAQSANSLQVRLAVTKFATRGKHLVAIGQTIATYQTTQGGNADLRRAQLDAGDRCTSTCSG